MCEFGGGVRVREMVSVRSVVVVQVMVRVRVMVRRWLRWWW